MSTENDYRPEGTVNEENKNVSREGGYQSQDGQYRSYRPRPNYNREGGNRPYRPYNAGGQQGYNRYSNMNNERPRRPRFVANQNNSDNMNGGDAPQHSYHPRMNYNNGDQGLYRPRPNYNPNYNRGGNDAVQRPYRPNYNNYNNGGNRPQRAYNPYYNTEDEQQSMRPRRPRINNGGYGQGGGRPRVNQQGNRPMRPRTADYNPNAKYSMKKQIEYKEILTDPNEPIRLNKFLANAGICSRREADELITAGAVSVNGQVVTELGTKIIRADEVMFHDQPVKLERKVYILLNKPKDCVTTSDDPQERKTVMDYVKNACRERIYPVGRLDRNTTGVLLLTNDGDLASKLTHPKFLKKKVYHVYLDKPLTKADMDQVLNGVTLDDGEIRADAINYVSEKDRSQVGIEIHSGRNRIVRRLFEAIGYKVVKLDRAYFAGLTKKGLKRGDWRFLTESEVNMLRMGSFE